MASLSSSSGAVIFSGRAEVGGSSCVDTTSRTTSACSFIDFGDILHSPQPNKSELVLNLYTNSR